MNERWATWINLGDYKGWRGDALKAESLCDGLCQRRLACAEVALEKDEVAGLKLASDTRAHLCHLVQ